MSEILKKKESKKKINMRKKNKKKKNFFASKQDKVFISFAQSVTCAFISTVSGY